MKNSKPIQVEIDPNVIVQKLDDEAVLLNLTDEHYFGLDNIGLRFWELLEEHKDSNKVIETMKTEYSVSKERLHLDLGKFVVELETAGLLKILHS